ncbi:conserved hypothetical protein [Thermoanaerobacter italicus Ab9]|uniref:Uncharacterized protein n=1 Tax=Thermoanaerobacter italicus (strain DSM 9252 / Ab9) TaxID=580331 RepID=D3T4F0_THEIA|nr:DUF6514 family protein [Thermoanaerobacter italicus]ADD03102.1 conserved hypothetical protein [Thermoanaerobacter italicus Ab9]
MYYRKVSEYISTREEEKRNITTHYIVVMSEIGVFNGKEEVKLPSYGIKIHQEIFDGEKEKIEIIEEKVTNISPYFEKVDKLAQFFKEMTVSPLHLYEIIDDIWEDYITDYDRQTQLCKVAI